MVQKKSGTNGRVDDQVKKAKAIPKSKQGTNGIKRNDGSKGGLVHSSSWPSVLALLGCLVVALVAFSAGIFTRPLISFRDAYETQQRALAKGRTRKSSSAAPDNTSATTTAANDDPCSDEVLAQFLHDDPVRGMHFVCMQTNGTLDLYREAVATTHQQAILEKQQSWNALKELLEESLDMHPMENRQNWAIFNSVGEKLAERDDAQVDMRRLRKEGLLVIMRGGQWLWPGVRIGFRRTVDLSLVPGLPSGIEAEKRNATLETLSLRPLVVAVEGFLSDEECNIIRDVAAPKVRYSGVVLKDVDEGRPASDFRTSQSTFLSSNEHPALKTIDYRTAGLVRIPRSHQETVQVLRYGPTEYYSAHNDYFDPKEYKNDQNTLRLIQHGKRNRLATVFWYLSDVSDGGHTAFPRFNGAPQPTDFKDCSKGLLVKPERGKVIIFYSLTADGELDPLSLHGACAVKGDNTKWAGNKWIWNAEMGYIRDA